MPFVTALRGRIRLFHSGGLGHPHEFAFQTSTHVPEGPIAQVASSAPFRHSEIYRRIKSGCASNFHICAYQPIPNAFNIVVADGRYIDEYFLRITTALLNISMHIIVFVLMIGIVQWTRTLKPRRAGLVFVFVTASLQVCRGKKKPQKVAHTSGTSTWLVIVKRTGISYALNSTYILATEDPADIIEEILRPSFLRDSDNSWLD